MKKLIIFGSGGHSKVVLDIAEKMIEFDIQGFIDDYLPTGSKIMGLPILGNREKILELKNTGGDFEVIVAIGNNRLRREISTWLRHHGLQMARLIHPSAQIGRDVTVGTGTVLMAGVIVNSGTNIGDDVILNTNCSVDHDCIVESGVHIAPGVSICGGVTIGTNSILGVGSSVIPSKKIGNNVVVAAGAVVVNDIKDDVTVIGVPAK